MPKDEWWRAARKILAEKVQQLRERYLEGQAPQASHKATRPSCEAEEPPPKCPKCGREMVLRVAEKGGNMGLHFWGCSRYPACKGAVNMLCSGRPKKKKYKKAHKMREELRFNFKRRIR